MVEEQTPTLQLLALSLWKLLALIWRKRMVSKHKSLWALRYKPPCLQTEAEKRRLPWVERVKDKWYQSHP